MTTSTENKNILNAGYSPIGVHLQPVLDLSDEQLYDFSQINRDLQIERNLISGRRNKVDWNTTRCPVAFRVGNNKLSCKCCNSCAKVIHLFWHTT
jgi:hypothetical protein